MSFDFHLPFPVVTNGKAYKPVQPQASTPGPVSTEPEDLTLWSDASATLCAIAAGPIKYVPPTGASGGGALVIHAFYTPWSWTTLENESDDLSSDQIPAYIYYENVN